MKFCSSAGILFVGHNIPFSIPCCTGFIAAPPYILTTKYHCFGRKSANKLSPGGIIVCLPSFSFRMCTVKPNFVNISILRKYLKKLIQKIFVVVIYYKFKLCLVLKGATLNFTWYSSLGVLTQIAIQSFRILNLIQIGR